MKIKPIQIGNFFVNELLLTPLVINIEESIAQWSVVVKGEKLSYQQDFLIDDPVEYAALLKNFKLDYVANLSLSNLGLEKDVTP